MSIEVVPHPRCLRGLHYLYRVPLRFDPAAVASRLEAQIGPCVRADEAWGPRVVPRIIVPFQVEYRVADRDGEVSLIHRSVASPAQRDQSAAWLRAVLEELLQVS